MCGRFELSGPTKAVADLFKLPEPPAVLKPRYNIAPTQPVPVVARKGDGTRALGMVRWGLVPGWANSPGDVKPQINARADGVATKPFFQAAFRSQRCLVVADGYFEWPARDRPHLIRRRDGGPFAFAGLWDVWTDGSEKLVTCCFVTTDAADWVAPIHPRMPVILRPDDFDAWLSHDTPAPALLDLLRPYPGDDLEAVQVGTAVNNVRNDSPECLAPAA